MATALPPGPLLVLDASTMQPVVAIAAIDAAAATYTVLAGESLAARPNQASSALCSAIEAALARAGLAARDLVAVACGRGPGTFTGTRVAVATAMGLACGVSCPAVPVSTLAAVAASADADGPIVALLDARRGEVYAAAYERDGAELRERGPETCASLPAWLATLPAAWLQDAIAIGPGLTDEHSRALPAALAARARPCLGPTPEGLVRAALAAIRAGRADDPERLRAVYLRDSYAELGVNRPKVPMTTSPWVDPP